MAKKPKDQGPELRIELFTRTYVPYEIEKRIDDITARLKKLEEEGKIEEYQTWEWSKELRTSNEAYCDFSKFVLDKVDEFEEWAERNKAEIYPFFDKHELRSNEVMIFPITCLAIYKGDELQAVFPHSDSEDNYTVPDALSMLESNDPVLEIILDKDSGADRNITRKAT